MEFEKAKELFKKNTETMAAYSHAMGVLSYDSETAAPKNSAEILGISKNTVYLHLRNLEEKS